MVLYSHDLGMAMLIGLALIVLMGMAILGVECHPVCRDSRFPELISNREL